MRSDPYRAAPRLIFHALAVVSSSATAFGGGAVLHKSGPIQASANGAYVWAVNPDHDSISRIATSDLSVTEFSLPPGGPHRPSGLALSGDGAEVWVAAPTSDHVFVLDAASGAVTHAIPIRAGAAPSGVAVSPSGASVVVTLHHAGEAAVFDRAGKSLVGVIPRLAPRPFGIAFTSNANEAWITHTIADGEDSHLTAIDVQTLRVTVAAVLKSVNPKHVADVAGDPDPIPEGGYLLTRGHPAQPPGSSRLWFLTQYHNFHNDVFTPDGTIQSAIHKVNLTTGLHLGTAERVVLTAVYVHGGNNTLLGDGWNARVAGPVDVAFDAAGTFAYVAHEYSDDVLVLRTTAGNVRPSGAAPLVEIPVGSAPIGIAASPTDDRLYVLNSLSRDVSVIDASTNAEIARVPVTPTSPEPLAPEILRGAQLFHTTSDARLSGNGKVACASCHPGGGTDGMAWVFGQFGAGHRQTMRLGGLALSFGPQAGGRGQLHRSGDRDEVQDFDFTARGPLMGGTGFLAAPNPPLGAPNAGLDADLDALAAYVLSLPPIERSPQREPAGGLSRAALRGGAIFRNTGGGPLDVGCIGCHTAPNFTDLAFHDVGGSTRPPENEGPPFNTPSLVGSWAFGPYFQAAGDGSRAHSLGNFLRHARNGVHGDTSGLNRRQMQDLEAFLKSIDGALAASGIGDVADTAPPRVRAVRPIRSTRAVVIFDETVDPATAGDPANYVFTDGRRAVVATSAAVDAERGDRVVVDAPLGYFGCDVTYTLLPGPIEDVAGLVQGGANNVLDVADPANIHSFGFDGTMTVTFGDTGLETFGGVAADAGIVAGLTTWSHARWQLRPDSSPPMKGFIRFDFAPALTGECGVTDASQILDASFTALPESGYRGALELHRCLMPWGEPPNDWCSNCNGAVTVRDAMHPDLRWHQSGARAVGGSGTTVAEYYPSGSFDVAATVDATATIDAVNERVAFGGPGMADAFRFWFENPAVNFGYAVHSLQAAGTFAIFHGADDEDGTLGQVLSITFALPVDAFDDCNANGVADACDVSGGGSDDVNGNGTPDECECIGDLNSSGVVDLTDLTLQLAAYGTTAGGDIDGDGDTDLADVTLLLARWGAVCP